MLTVNVGLSRKLSRDFNSSGYSVNVEGEVCVPLDEPERVLDKVRELYDLADGALREQIDRDQSDGAIAERDADPAPTIARTPRPAATGRVTRTNRLAATPDGVATERRDAALDDPRNPPATNKQVQFLLSLGKRLGLDTPALETRAAEVVGRRVGLYDLTKREAGALLDTLMEESPAPTRRG
jgi:hypothetical protein